jgi:glycosyltransferase involved in cell wall biosynthesis
VTSQHEAVRGAAIACENLLKSLMLGEPASEFDFHIFAGASPSNFHQWLSTESAGPVSRFHVRSVGSLSEGDPLRDVGLWYEPQANYSLVYQLRDRFAGLAYPVVSTVHEISIHTMLFEQFTRVLLCESYPHDSFVCSSAAAKAALQKLMESVSNALERRYGLSPRFSGQYYVIPLPVDLDAFRPVEKPVAKHLLGLPADCTLLLYFGLISPLKADLIPCLAALSECGGDLDQYNLILGIAGGGDAQYIKILKQFAHAIGFPGSRLRIFKDPTDEVRNTLFQAADIFTSPGDSVQEMFGLSVVEAMACGVPQVVADWSGYRDTVQDGITGFLVPTYWARCDTKLHDTGFLLGWAHDHYHLGQSVAMDLEYWKSSVLRLIRNRELRGRMAEASRKHARLFGIDVIRRQYFDLWRELLSRPLPDRRDRSRLMIERPRYYEWFHDFASRQVSSGMPIETVRNRIRKIVADTANTVQPCARMDVLDSVFRAVEDGQAGTVADVVTGLADTIDSTTVEWHIMWALKHGLLRLKSEVRASDGAR